MIYNTYTPGFPPFGNQYFKSKAHGFYGHIPNYKINQNQNYAKQSKNSLCDSSVSHTNNNDKFPKPIFEIFGIKLFFDDLLLIALLLFLYNEKIDDKYLFFALIMLLLS